MKFRGLKEILGCAALLLSIPLSAQRAPNLARTLSTAMGAEGRLLWIDATANFWRKKKVNGLDELLPYTITREGITEIVRNAKLAHINTLVVDVKPLVGQVIFPSQIAPRLRSWQGRPVPEIDILQAFVEEGHKAGLRVHASLNILSEGHKYYKVGLAYERPDWQSIVYTVNRGLVTQNRARLSFRVPKEPDSPDKPLLLADDAQADASLERTGLDRPDDNDTNGGGGSFGKLLYVSMDADNKIEGIADAALLGEEPLAPSEDGKMLLVRASDDREWCLQNLDLGMAVTFDMRTELIPIAEAKSEKIACFINPLHPEARKHQIDLIKEIITNYAVDGIVLDRCRYSNIYNDFSNLTKQAFVKWLGKPIARWPQDIYTFSPKPGKRVVPGLYYKQWLEFRAQTIRDFVAEVAQTVRSKPHLSFGTYVGAWYPSYYEVGVNWGSEKTHLRYAWYTDDYPKTGYAEFFDWIALGSYNPFARQADAKRAGKYNSSSVEGLTELGTSAVANGAFTFGGIYVPDYKNDPEMMINALQAASLQGQGWMIFDLTYIEEFNFWNVIERTTKADAPAPDSLRNLLPLIRKAMDIVR